MAAVRGKDTKPELIIRKGLHARGFRYRLYDRALPGRPDLVLPKHHAIIFINGCFWHGHDCNLFRWPATREDFWHHKISSNKERDARNLRALQALGWRTAIVWECALKGKQKLPTDKVIDTLHVWLSSDDSNTEIRGAPE
ncbi:very short patch repair endonuclease [Martelella mediterranea]|uniref:very short patch repair endonuclease n=1 Tax=Martelella mediterranea TaxID=293089 RepID=UPI001FE00777|nr:very short patch repair endonuclease [Martelella mediterranea]